MHIALVHKPDAGDGDHRKKDLKKLLKAAGHRVTYLSSDDPWEGELPGDADLLLVGGGDGTVGSVLRRLVHRDLPFAVLPLGTANNVATRLGWTGTPEEVIEGLETARPTPFDVGVARGPWGAQRFIEGVGLGPFPRAMAFGDAFGTDLLHPVDAPEKELRRDLRLLRAFVHNAEARPWSVELDGEWRPGPYLLIEAMHLGLIGPNLVLAPEADLGDGHLSVVLLAEADRPLLDAYLAQRLEGDPSPPALPVHRARHVRLLAEGSRLHLDDDLWPPKDAPPSPSGLDVEVELSLEQGALTALVPD